MEKKRAEFEPLVALGIFLVIFGAVVCYATRVPEGFWDKMVNLSSGLVLLGIGIGAILLGIKRSRKSSISKE